MNFGWANYAGLLHGISNLWTAQSFAAVSIVDNKVCAAPIIPPQATLFATAAIGGSA